MPGGDATTFSLIQTKLQPPRARGTSLRRARLDHLLSEVVEAPLTVVVAPAGFGKTTLLLDWHDTLQDGATVAWLALDEADGEPVRFARHFRAAADSVLGRAEASEQLSLTALVESVIDDAVALTRPGVLILDDYHLVDSAEIHAAMTLLVEHLPPLIHVVIGSRSDPPLPLARLRARRRLLEVCADDLRFTGDEAAGLLNEIEGLGLSGEQVARLEARTEGWGAALHLAALSVRGEGDIERFIEALSGTHRSVFDDLAGELFAAQDEATRSFLMRTSILDRLSGALCDAVSEAPGGAERLAAFVHANLFTAVIDGEGRWYRYHHLFRDFLRKLLADRHEADLPRLHRRASEWLAANGLLEEALQQAFDAGDNGWTLALVERAFPEAALRGEIMLPRFERWVDRIPAVAVERRPRVALPLALSRLLAGQLREATRLIRQVEAILDGAAPAPYPMDEAELDHHRGSLATAHAYLARYRGDPEAALAAAYHAIAALPPDEPMQAWLEVSRQFVLFEAWAPRRGADLAAAAQKCIAQGHMGGLAAMLALDFYRLVLEGRLKAAEEQNRSAFQLVRDLGTFAPAGILHGTAAELRYEAGDLADAEDAAQRYLAMGPPAASPDLFVPPEATLARVQAADGRVAEAKRSLAMLVARGKPVETVQAKRFFPALAAHIQLLIGESAGAAERLQPLGLSATDEPTFALEYPLLVYARVRIATGSPADVLPLLTRIEERARMVGRHGRALEARLLIACAHWHARDEDAALTAFREVLAHAEREGYARTLLDEGEPVLAMLRRSAAGDQHAAYATRLLLLADERIASARAEAPLARRPRRR